MNRSILIVICDFMVTSMIFLNGGFSAIESPFRDGGGATIDRSTVQIIIAKLQETTAALEAERSKLIGESGGEPQNRRINALTSELAATRAKIEFMERRARLSRAEAGPLSPAQLQKELEEEIAVRTRAEAIREQLEQQLKAAAGNLDRAEKQHSDVMHELENRSRELAARSSALEETQGKLNAVTGEAAALRARLSGSESALAATRKSLGTAEANVKDYRTRLGNAENSIAFLQGRSSAMEKELAASRDRTAAAEKSVKAREVELAAAKTQLAHQQTLIQNAMRERSQALGKLAEESAAREKAQQEAARLSGDLTAAHADLNAANTKLNSAEEKLRSDVLMRYTASAVTLTQKIIEDRLLGDRQEESTLYLPAVKIGGKNYLVTALRTLAGNRNNASALGDVSELAYRAGNASAGKGANLPLAGPIRVARSDCRVALIEVPGDIAAPLPLLPREELKKRGIQDLYLFKSGSFGKDSTILDARCSMSFESGDDYLYIRNGARVSSELKAEIGDLVLTKQGELVAVVVALEEFDFGRQVEARCFVFAKAPDVPDLPGIHLSRGAGQKYYRDFTDKLNFWFKQAQTLDARKRRR